MKIIKIQNCYQCPNMLLIKVTTGEANCELLLSKDIHEKPGCCVIDWTVDILPDCPLEEYKQPEPEQS